MAMRGKPKTNTKKIGDKELSPATLMMGLGYDPVLSEGSLKPPIFLTSTFAFESAAAGKRSEEHTSELQSLMRISYAVFCLKKKITNLRHAFQLYHDLQSHNR